MATTRIVRPPMPPPFAVGQVIEFVGKPRWPYFKGLRGTVFEVFAAHQGSGRLVDLDEDTGDEIFDESRDGACAVRFKDLNLGTYADGRTINTRAIRASSADSWRVVTS